MSSILKIRGSKDVFYSLALLAIGLLLLMAPVGDTPYLKIKEARVIFLQYAPVILWLAVWWMSIFLYLWVTFGREDFKKTLGPGVRTGIIFHLGLLLLDFLSDMGEGRISLKWFFNVHLHVVTWVGFGAIAWWVAGHWTVKPNNPVTKKEQLESRLCIPLTFLLVWSLLQTLWMQQFLLFSILLLIYTFFWKKGAAASDLLEHRYRLIAARFSSETTFSISLFLISLFSLFFFAYQATSGFTKFHEYFYGVYLNWARDLLAGRPVLSGEATGYWVFVAVIFRIFDESKVALQIVQIIINASIPLLSYLVMRRLVPKVVARLAALILTFNFIHQWDSVNFHWSILVTFYSMTAIATFLSFNESNQKIRWIYLAISGLAFGLLVAVRTENVLFVPVFLWWYWRRRHCEPKGVRRMIGTPKIAATIILLAFLSGAPFAAINYQNMGTIYPVGNKGGKVGSQYAIQDIWSQYYYYVLPGGENPIKEPAKAWREIKKDPWGFFGRLFVKGGQESPWPGGSILQRLRNGIPILFSTVQFSYFDFFYFQMLSRWHLYLNFYAVLLAAVGIWALAKDVHSHPFWRAINTYLIARYFMHVFLTNHPEGAYRYASPFLPFVAIYVALGIWIIWKAERPRSLRSALPTSE